MHFILIGLMIVLVLAASYFDLRWGAGLLAFFLVFILILITVSDFGIFGGSRNLETDTVTVDFVDANYGYRGTYYVNARMKNNHPEREISDFAIKVQALDCPAEDSALDDCLVISETQERVELEIPQNQARDFQVATVSGDLEPRGHLNWKLEVTELKSH